MSCPYENNPNIKQLPCHWVEHPHNPDLRICDICRSSYNINQINQSPPKWLEPIPWILTGFIILLLL